MTTALRGVVVATALPYKEDPSAPAGLAVDFDRYAEHVDWLMSNGCHGVGPNGSLGEYSSLTDEERRRVVQVAVEAVGGRGTVIAGVHGPGWHQAKKWAEIAGEDGATGVLALPPTMYRASNSQVVEHYTKIAEAGLPMMIYNNPFDTKVDLVPDLVAEIARIPQVVAIKEFTGDVRRLFEIREKCEIDVVAGADDVLFELMADGAVGWFAGFPNVFPAESRRLYDLMLDGKFLEARELYQHLVAVFRWDSRTEFVQAIKLSMDLIGRYGGPCRPPRGPLTPEHRAQIEAETKRAVEALAG
ncbi:dihydrodipicolinate synthase family protein [Paractinoplanes brasiliensis]|uniref:4-hydroxy-tetrahydrodipicolinate synthase n=1 Tax=Paractinoplanes brasiliensis TaxID=52695 RepID=A0A4V3C7A5_9ACTN|nr:dihydrodipicolinate synthase family protein [Actinoplanes brasiliensis]TDO36978.1 4-hydroxy-tetrahydrodipicolinate synthase [Actinoplanes brasiliensis]GID30501.1 dihydrodipicolinate synthase family protein [Actinoplanes brasiliensis]